jgi:uncharacterized protein (DUF58 family)
MKWFRSIAPTAAEPEPDFSGKGEASATGASLLRRLEWRVKHVADTMVSGEYRSAFRGRGREFDQVVKYQFGDDVRDIDWNVTARLGEPYRKRFVEEREVTLALVVEDSLSLQFGSGDTSKREALMELAGLMALVAAANRDRLAVLYGSPSGHWFLPPKRGLRGIRQSAAKLLSVPVPPAESGGEVDLAWKFLLRTLPRHSVVIWLGDFPPRATPEFWPAFCRKFQVFGFRVEDPWESSLPDLGAFSAFDPTTGEVVTLDTGSSAMRQRHGTWIAERESAFADLFPHPASRMVLRAGEPVLESLLHFFHTRERRLR